MGIIELVVILALVAVFIAMLIGLYSMGRGGTFDREVSVSIMYLRIGLQALAVALLLLALYLGKG